MSEMLPRISPMKVFEVRPSICREIIGAFANSQINIQVNGFVTPRGNSEGRQTDTHRGLIRIPRCPFPFLGNVSKGPPKRFGAAPQLDMESSGLRGADLGFPGCN